MKRKTEPRVSAKEFEQELRKVKQEKFVLRLYVTGMTKDRKGRSRTSKRSARII